MIIVLCLSAFLLSCVLTHLIRRYALAKSLIDIPNARSSHSMPTPRGGGLSVVSVFLCFALILGVYAGNSATLGLVVASLAVAGIGFWDDHDHIPARWRLLVHSSAAALALFFLPPLPPISLFSLSINVNLFASIFYLFALVWLLNLYNFMDGIDGIASTETITVALSMTILLVVRGYANDSVLLLLLAAAVAGFLVWNWPHAKIFMGDACSGFLGFILGIFALLTSASGAVSLWSWLILLGVFITDASFTLIRRILNGDVWYEAHSSHAYQHYARQLIHTFQQQGFEHQLARVQSHRQINFLLIAINFCWLLPLAIAATFLPFWAELIAVVAFIPLLFVTHALKAGCSQ